MTMSGGHKPRGSSTICLPWLQEPYELVIGSHADFRLAIDQFFRDMPELFPDAFEFGYTLKDSRTSTKRGVCLRRICLKATGEVFTIRPSFLMPYMVGLTDDVQAALFLRAFAVPFWALARVFGHDPMYWYRIEVSLGRFTSRWYHPAASRFARTSARGRTPPDAGWSEELHRHRRRRRLLPGGRTCPDGLTFGSIEGLRDLPLLTPHSSTPHFPSARDGERRWLGVHEAGVADAVPVGGAAALLSARLAEHPQPREVERVIRGVIEEGVGGISRP